MSEKNYSVLMSVYWKENPQYLRQAMMSIYNQTISTNDFVLICDGTLSKELDNVIADMQEQFGSVLNVVRLQQNSGLGNALNIGIKYCKNELIARMDSDDISYTNRCEKQLKVFSDYPDIAICSGIVEEFSESIDIIDARRVPPESSEEIIEYAKKRNPFNHPCVMYKKQAVELAGGYKEIYLLEDYYLWLRMLMQGMQGYNLQEPLLYMRAGAGMYLRRSGWKYVQAQKKLFEFMWESGFISRNQYIKSIVIRSASALSPNWLRKIMFKTFLRR